MAVSCAGLTTGTPRQASRLRLFLQTRSVKALLQAAQVDLKSWVKDCSMSPRRSSQEPGQPPVRSARRSLLGHCRSL